MPRAKFKTVLNEAEIFFVHHSALTVPELAAKLGCSVNTVKTVLAAKPELAPETPQQDFPPGYGSTLVAQMKGPRNTTVMTKAMAEYADEIGGSSFAQQTTSSRTTIPGAEFKTSSKYGDFVTSTRPPKND